MVSEDSFSTSGAQAAATAKGYIDQGSKTVEGLVGAETLAKGKDLFGQGLSSLEATANKMVGADKIIGIDLNPEREAMARRFGLPDPGAAPC